MQWLRVDEQRVEEVDLSFPEFQRLANLGQIEYGIDRGTADRICTLSSFSKIWVNLPSKWLVCRSIIQFLNVSSFLSLLTAGGLSFYHFGMPGIAILVGIFFAGLAFRALILMSGISIWITSIIALCTSYSGIEVQPDYKWLIVSSLLFMYLLHFVIAASSLLLRTAMVEDETLFCRIYEYITIRG